MRISITVINITVAIRIRIAIAVVVAINSSAPIGGGDAANVAIINTRASAAIFIEELYYTSPQ